MKMKKGRTDGKGGENERNRPIGREKNTMLPY
jgi:hypothetical protein